MKMISFLFKARGALLALMGGLVLLSSLDANAIPVFARQTGFKCVACHVGGEYPQLTALGRYFKLTGYTQGDANDIFNLTTNIDRPPIAIMVQTAKEFYANVQAATPNSAHNYQVLNGIGGASGINPPSSSYDVQVISLFSGGKIVDNAGYFLQYTGQKYDTLANTGNNTGFQASALDNTEFRYADHVVNNTGDWIYGAYINNRPTMSDVWNTTENWASGWINYFNVGQVQAPITFLDSSPVQHGAVGIGSYVYKDKTWYGELGLYKSTTNGPFSILTLGNGYAPNAAPNAMIDRSPYFRFAYNREWGPHEIEVGLHGMVSYAHNLTQTFASVANGGATPFSLTSGTLNQYRDIQLDSQYQYILDPHYFAAHFRLGREYINNNASTFAGAPNAFGANASNPTDNLTEYYLDAEYIYKAKYGAMLTFQGARGSNDTGLYGAVGTGSPDWDSITPHVFVAPWQNVRIGFMYTFYTKIGGASNGISFGGDTAANGFSQTKFGASDFNVGMLYATFVY